MQVSTLRFAFFFEYFIMNIYQKMKKKNFIFISLLIFPLLFCSCSKSGRFAIDTTKNRVDVKINRFDSALISMDTVNLKAGIDKLYSNYPEFMSLYIENVLNVNPADSATIRKTFFQFLSDSTFAKVNKKDMETFSNVSDIEKSISDAFTYIHHYFPEKELPKVYFFVSGFNRSVLMDDRIIGIGTDLYLGSDFPSYQDFTYQYLMYNMRRECVATDLVSATLFRMFLLDNSQDRLLDNMLYRGKMMYLISVFMPGEKPEDLMGYKPEQMEWCKTYEKEVWGAMIDQKDLFSTDMQIIRKYMNDAPFTSTISQDSPGRLGTWLGWQIVNSYMNKNKEVSLTDLMKDNNYQKMLEDSGYRP